MKIYSFNNQFPEPLPFRIRLPDGSTRTDPATFSNEELESLGYILAPTPPNIQENQKLEWDSGWVIVDKSAETIELEQQSKVLGMWAEIRKQRDTLMKDFEWRYDRYNRETRLNLTPSDKIEDIDNYMQALADITKQPDPFNIIWPIFAWKDITLTDSDLAK